MYQFMFGMITHTRGVMVMKGTELDQLFEVRMFSIV